MNMQIITVSDGYEKTVLNYLLLRVREARYEGKVTFVYNVFDGDEDGDILSRGYDVTVEGTYKDGLFNVKIRDSYLKYLDEDE